MTSRRTETLYLGTDRPLLPAAIEWFRQRAVTAEASGSSEITCVVPATRAVRRLRELLGHAGLPCDTSMGGPLVITTGELADLLISPPAPPAGDLEQTLAWARTLRDADPVSLESLVPGAVPEREPMGPWLELAATIRRMKSELAANRLRFADVVEACELPIDRGRWQTLAQFLERYLLELARAERSDPDEERRRAVGSGRCRVVGTLVLIGTTDLTPMLSEMLRSADGEIVALVAAAEDEADRFDEFGVARVDAWRDVTLPLRDDHLIAASDITDQASAVAETFAEFAKRFSADQVTIGVTDESQVGPIEVVLRGCGVASYRHLGWTIGETSVGRLLSLVATYLQRRSWESLAALVRHIEVREEVTRAIGEAWLDDLDGLLANHFPIRVDDVLPPEAADAYPAALLVARHVDRWLEPIGGDRQRDAVRPIAWWAAALDRWLAELHPDPDVTPAEGPDGPSAGQHAVRTIEALRTCGRLLRRWAELSDRLDVATSGPLAIDLITGRVSEIRVGGEADAGRVEILGWLDLALDDAPAMVVNGLNHPLVPEAAAAGGLLPASIRTRITAAENDRRYARDLIAMRSMLVTRDEIRFIVGRRSADGSPTPPSRLLAAAPAEDVARRIRQLFHSPRSPARIAHAWDAGPPATRIVVPTIDRPTIPKTLSVTAFRDYLACPYRFYLRHVRRLRPLDDVTSELAANQFGDLVHAAVERFGLSEHRDEGDPEKIEARLLEHLGAYAAEHYGEHASIAVRLQIAQAEKRLRVVAQRQAERVAAGWVIKAAEAQVNEREYDEQGNPKPAAGIVVDDQFMGLRGRFDRIDHHPKSGRWAILDYKTHGHLPEKKHLQRTSDGYRWVDLQLPLYRMMIPFLGIDADPDQVELGYFNVSEKPAETRINVAEFDTALLEVANEQIRDCVRGILAGHFEPTDDRVPYDDYAMILQTGVSQRLLDDAADADEVGDEL